jgi:hypothetical protein
MGRDCPCPRMMCNPVLVHWLSLAFPHASTSTPESITAPRSRFPICRPCLQSDDDRLTPLFEWIGEGETIGALLLTSTSESRCKRRNLRTNNFSHSNRLTEKVASCRNHHLKKFCPFNFVTLNCLLCHFWSAFRSSKQKVNGNLLVRKTDR